MGIACTLIYFDIATNEDFLQTDRLRCEALLVIIMLLPIGSTLMRSNCLTPKVLILVTLFSVSGVCSSDGTSNVGTYD